jgi:hypothetical protein
MVCILRVRAQKRKFFLRASLPTRYFAANRRAVNQMPGSGENRLAVSGMWARGGCWLHGLLAKVPKSRRRL